MRLDLGDTLKAVGRALFSLAFVLFLASGVLLFVGRGSYDSVFVKLALLLVCLPATLVLVVYQVRMVRHQGLGFWKSEERAVLAPFLVLAPLLGLLINLFIGHSEFLGVLILGQLFFLGFFSAVMLWRAFQMIIKFVGHIVDSLDRPTGKNSRKLSH